MDPQSSAVSEDVGIEGGSDVSLREMSTSEQLQSSVSVENNGHIRKLRTNENLNHSLMYCKIKESIYSRDVKIKRFYGALRCRRGRFGIGSVIDHNRL